DTLAGEGSISANGGNGGNTTYPGGGGGGRISLAWTSGNRAFSGVISASGGLGYRSLRASPGTIYVPDTPVNLWDELYDASHPVNGSVSLAQGTYYIQDLHVTNNARLGAQGDDVGVIVDNPDATFVGTWDGGTSTGSYGGDIRWHAAGDGSATATWTPDVPETANYNVYVWYKEHSNRARNAKYTVYYNGGSETISVNQEVRGSKWNLLGTFPFLAGTSGYVQLTDDADEYVIADAIMLAKPPVGNESDPAHGRGVVINSDNITVDAGSAISANGEGFGPSTGPGVAADAGDCSGGGGYGGQGGDGRDYAGDCSGGGGYGGQGGDGRDSLRGLTYGSVDKPASLGSGGGGVVSGRGGGAVRLSVTDTLTIDGTVSAQGTQGIGNYAGGSGGSVWIVCHAFEGIGTISANGGSGANTTYPGGGGGGRISLQWTSGNRTFAGMIKAAGGRGYRSLYASPGTVYVPDTLWNELYNSSYPVNGSVALAPGSYDIATLHVTNNATLSCQGGDAGIVVDNADATFVGTWLSSPGTGRIGYDFSYHAAGDGNATVTWTPDVPDAASYNVYVWYTEYSNRATNAKYTVNYDGGSTTIEVNQRTNGSEWYLLGACGISLELFRLPWAHPAMCNSAMMPMD
ncbi:MAG: hypothetical protein JRI70_11830, partial [Deltaproteobacteria bacterium]|nr:hypothetical protein [Deltaproteobacteria bacterium]